MKNLIRRIKKTYAMAGAVEGRIVINNVASLSWLQTISYILPLIIIPYLFRVIGPEKFGLIAFAQAFVQYFMILTDYGFSVSATKEISLCNEDKTKVGKVYSAVMTIKVAMVLISLFLLLGIVNLVPKFGNDWILYALSFGVVIGNALFPVWFFQGTESMTYIANLNIIGEFIYAALILLFIKHPHDYLMIPLITSGSSLIIGLMGQYVVLNRFKISFQLPGEHELIKQLKAGWNVFISVVAINAYTTTRVFAVGLLTNNTVTGFYSIAEKIANVAQTFPLSSFSQAIFPRLSKIYDKNKSKAFEMMQQIQMITVNISLIFLPIIFILAPFIVKIFCGDTYPEVVTSLRLLLISVFFISANAFRVQFLLVCGKTKVYSQIHITMALMGLPLILLLINYYSYMGAAMATVAIEGGILAMTYFTVRKFRFPSA
ncbi:MAG: flippase [Candidatus Omnitrophica bacterium]|nr:flippase [Candidatus Omnitrophota bacterium]